MSKITAFVMTEKGLAFMRAALEAHRDLFAAVVVGTDAALSDDRSAEILALCQQHQLPAVRRGEAGPVVTEYVLAVSWRWLIDHPPQKLIVFHDSLLPRYRGFAPLPTALINGEPVVGVTALFGAAEYDAGPILAQSSTRLSYPVKIAEAIELVTRNYVEAGLAVLAQLRAGQQLVGVPQDEAVASYSAWRDEADFEIDWREPAAKIRRFVDAVGDPYHGACTTIGGQLFRVLDAVEAPDVRVELRDVGKVLFVEDGCPVVICGTGLLKITRLTDADGAPALPLPKFRVRFGS